METAFSPQNEMVKEIRLLNDQVEKMYARLISIDSSLLAIKSSINLAVASEKGGTLYGS